MIFSLAARRLSGCCAFRYWCKASLESDGFLVTKSMMDTTLGNRRQSACVCPLVAHALHCISMFRCGGGRLVDTDDER